MNSLPLSFIFRYLALTRKHYAEKFTSKKVCIVARWKIIRKAIMFFEKVEKLWICTVDAKALPLTAGSRSSRWFQPGRTAQKTGCWPKVSLWNYHFAHLTLPSGIRSLVGRPVPVLEWFVLCCNRIRRIKGTPSFQHIGTTVQVFQQVFFLLTIIKRYFAGSGCCLCCLHFDCIGSVVSYAQKRYATNWWWSSGGCFDKQIENDQSIIFRSRSFKLSLPTGPENISTSKNESQHTCGWFASWIFAEKPSKITYWVQF